MDFWKLCDDHFHSRLLSGKQQRFSVVCSPFWHLSLDLPGKTGVDQKLAASCDPLGRICAACKIFPMVVSGEI